MTYKHVKPGDLVKWESQAGGTWKEKQGVVLALLPKGEMLRGIPAAALKSHVKVSSSISTQERALVRVMGGKDGNIAYYYAPRMSRLELVQEAGPVVMKNWGVIGSDIWKAPELQTQRLHGEVYGHPRFPDGAPITSTTILDIVDAGDHKEVKTKNTTYHVYPDDVSPAAEEQYPGYYERLSMDCFNHR